MPPKRTAQKEPAAEPAVEPEAEPEGAPEPVPAQRQLDRLEQGLGRILGVLEVQGGELVETKEALKRAEAQNGDLLARITALEERGAPAPARWPSSAAPPSDPPRRSCGTWGTGYVRESGVKWMSGGTKRQCG